MATQITATLPTLNFPREVDYPTQEDWAAFSAATELNFGILGNDWSTQMQLWKTEANAMSIELNNNADIAQAVANYQGDWISQGYTLGQTVSVGEVYYICKLTHATGQNPTDVSSLYWNLALGNWSLKADKTETYTKTEVDALHEINNKTDKPTPIDTDNFALQEVGGDLKKVSYKNLFDKVSITGSTTFNGTTQTIDLAGIGNITLAIGDVIEVTGTTSNNKLFTVESIPNANRIIVNYEHRGTSTPIPSKRLINETINCAIKLYNRAKNAPLGQGQGWCKPASARTPGVTYTNYTNRVILVSSILYSAFGNEATLNTDGFNISMTNNSSNTYGIATGITSIVLNNSIYIVSNTQNTGIQCELR